MSKSDDVDIQRPGSGERVGAGIKSGTSGEDIIDLDITLIGGYGGLFTGCKGIFHPLLTGTAIKGGL